MTHTMTEPSSSPTVAHSVTELAWAKVNLYLHVHERRSDGYHAIESLVVFTELHDTIVISPKSANDTLSLHIDGPFAAKVPSDASNLCVKAAAAMRAHFGQRTGLDISLTKRIPVAAGLGGGSSDAAAVIRALIRMWGAAQDTSRILEIAADLGSDIPACYQARPLVMEGRGEVLRELPAPLPQCAILLVNPRVHLSTREVFAHWTPHHLGQIKPLSMMSVQTYDHLMAMLHSTRNDLLPAAQAICPEIKKVLSSLQNLPQADCIGMSGSGASCFALMRSWRDACEGQKILAKNFPDWWTEATLVHI